MFISEALRMWPPFVASDRICTKAYELEDKEGNKFEVILNTKIIFFKDSKYNITFY